MANNSDQVQNPIETEILIVGFGFSSVPLVRELQRDGKDFTVISGGESVWQTLEEAGRLDFDLVSSLQSSLFSFALTKRGELNDRYPLSSEFVQYQRELREEFQPENLINDTVTEIQNYADHSLVFTQKGAVFKAKHVVISTAFRRALMKDLTEFDFEAAENQTIVLNTSGDSGNLIAAKLIPRGNRVILRTNGVLTLDKFVNFFGIYFPLDQLEFHNVRDISRTLYRTVDGGTALAANLGPVGRMMFGENFLVRYPVAWRTGETLGWREAMPNGLVAIKMWAIDTFAELFDNEQLETHIKNGFLLNDLPFFVEHGMIELCPKSSTQLDMENKVLHWDGEDIKADYIFDAPTEIPNLPTIKRVSPTGEQTDYEYHYRQCFMGVLPESLNNVYILGLTRPTTGGLANIVEMQCLLAHSLITDEKRHHAITHNLSERLAKYDKAYYPKREYGPTDYLVWYGSYTEDIARLIGIAPSLRDVRSLRDLRQYYFLPNNPVKYRCEGRYKVDGAKAFLDKFWDAHAGFKHIMNYVGFWVLFQASAIIAILLSPMPWYASVPLAIGQFYNPMVALLMGNAIQLQIPLNIFMLICIAASLVTGSALPATIAVGGTLLAVFLGRKLGITRQLFNDLKFRRKAKYKDFFQRYKQAFLKVYPTKSSDLTMKDS